MAKCKVRYTKAGGVMAAGALKKATNAAGVVEFDIGNDGKKGLTVRGRDNAGELLDLSGIATLTQCESDDPSIFTLDPPTGFRSVVNGVKSGTANALFTVTMNDPATGPFSLKLPGTCKTGPVSGLDVEFDAPVVL